MVIVYYKDSLSWCNKICIITFECLCKIYCNVNICSIDLKWDGKKLKYDMITVPNTVNTVALFIFLFSNSCLCLSVNLFQSVFEDIFQALSKWSLHVLAT